VPEFNEKSQLQKRTASLLAGYSAYHYGTAATHDTTTLRRIFETIFALIRLQ
jgi:hypothetical protein